MKLCMIGSRGHCGYVFESIADVPELSLAAVSPGCGDDPSRLLSMAEKAGFRPELHQDWRTMLDKVKPDVVCIDGPFDRHAEMCVEALRRKIHVFCEKPITVNYPLSCEMQASSRPTTKAPTLTMRNTQWDRGYGTRRKSTPKTTFYSPRDT